MCLFLYLILLHRNPAANGEVESVQLTLASDPAFHTKDQRQ